MSERNDSIGRMIDGASDGCAAEIAAARACGRREALQEVVAMLREQSHKLNDGVKWQLAGGFASAAAMVEAMADGDPSQ